MAVYPTSLLPMEPMSLSGPFPDSRYLFQVKWDGVRYLAFIDRGEIKLQNRRLRVKTHLYPELASMSLCLGGKRGIVDGEIIALGENGVPSFPRILQRDLVKGATPRLLHQVPAFFMAFDLLYLGVEPLMGLPLEERLELLGKHFEEGEFFRVTDRHQEGAKLYKTMEEREMEGIVAKKEGSPYRPGRKAGEWLKIKIARRQDCLMGGYVLKNGRVSSLLVGAYQGPSFLYLGRVSSGLTEEDLRMIRQNTGHLQRRLPPFSNPPAPDRSLVPVWLEPLLGVRVLFSQWTPDLKLRSPRVKGFLLHDDGDWTLK